MTSTEQAEELLGKCGIEACCPSNCGAVKAVAAALAEKDKLLEFAEKQIFAFEHLLCDPPPDVQESVIKKLDLVSRDALVKRDGIIADAVDMIELAATHNERPIGLFAEMSLYDRLTTGYDELLNERRTAVHQNFVLSAEIDRLRILYEHDHQLALDQASIVIEANTECNQMQAEINRLKLDMVNLTAQLFTRELEGYRSREAEIAQLKALNQRFWAALTPEKRHRLNVEMKGVDRGKI